jgi:hypothetical protein
MIRFALAIALGLAPASGLAKTRVLVDAPKPVAALLSKALKHKHDLRPITFDSEPGSWDVTDVCLNLGAAAVITVRQRGDVYTVAVINGADGEPLVTFRLTWGKRPPRALTDGDIAILSQCLARAKVPRLWPKAPPAAEPSAGQSSEPMPVADLTPAQPQPSPTTEVHQTSEPADVGPGPQALRLGVGVKVFSRQFGYTDDLFNALAAYKLPFGPALALDGDIYPAAFLTRGFAANVGVLGYFDYAFGITSQAADGTRYATKALDLNLALTVRIPVGDVLKVNPFVGYTMESFAVTSAVGPGPDLANVGYRGLRGGLMLRAHVAGPVFVQGSFAGRYLLNTGEIQSASRFPRLKAGGLDAQVAIPVALTNRFEVKLQADYTRYWYSMNPQPGDAAVAGGALDIYASGTLVAAFTL